MKPPPVVAELRGNQIDPENIPSTSAQTALPPDEQGPCEDVDPIDAATAITSKHGINSQQYEIDDPRPLKGRIPGHAPNSLGSGEVDQLQTALNQGKDAGEQCTVVYAFHNDGGKILLTRTETPNEARLRWQHEVSAKSFHSAIFGNKANHANVTAYDVAIGGGSASSDPAFYAYLCAVADWRLKKLQPKESPRPSVQSWMDFTRKFSVYWSREPKWRSELIEGNCVYYSTGQLPACIPSLREGLPTRVICQRVHRPPMEHHAHHEQQQSARTNMSADQVLHPPKL